MVMIGEKPWVRYIPHTETHGRFIVEPLERGYGYTLGNSLRRVLLSSLLGAAVTSIRIEGVSHQFSTIPGVVEDVLEIILNIKQLVIKSYSESPKVVTLKAKGKGEVKAADIEHDPEVEILNPDHHLATLESKGKLNIQMTVERGKGYVSAERNKKPGQPVGSIPVDSIFTPILKVNVGVEEVRVGPEINYDRLTLDVWVKGSIKPDQAVIESAKILARHIDMFVNLGRRTEGIGIAPVAEKVEEGILEMTIEDLELSARSSNCLRKAGISTVKGLINYTQEDLMKIENFGSKSAGEVKERLAEYKLALKGQVVEEEKPAESARGGKEKVVKKVKKKK